MDRHTEMKGKWLALRTWLLTAAAIMMVMSAVMGTAWAYFTTYTAARGGITLHLGHEERITEYFKNRNKRVDIEITKDSQPVYVRARGYCAQYNLTYSDVELNKGDTPVNNNWVAGGDDWMYYTKILQPGTDENGNNTAATADPLYVRINDVPEEDVQGLDDKKPFNVIIVYETTEVEYDKNGNPVGAQNANWENKKVDTNRIGGDN